jgi:transcriptional regulator of aroF, aroG, tyrA and aromatic amino acid transport
MKIKLTTENRIGLSQEVLAVFAKQNIDVKRVEVETGIMFIETVPVDNQITRTIATLLMTINGVNWVESISYMPALEKNLFLSSLLSAIPDPVFGINNKGEVIYQNTKFIDVFSLTKKATIKDVFVGNDWKEKVDIAATGNLPVNINTIAGPMLIEVRAINNAQEKINGAVIVLHKHENVATRSFVIEGSEIKGFESLICINQKMKEVINRAINMSKTNVPLVISGESGVGKRTIAHGVHYSGNRKHQLFSSLNCSTLKPQQVEIDLFGSFNSDASKAGLFEITDGGTIYLQNIHEMSESCQLKLLNFLQTKEFTRIGGSKVKTADVKLIVSCPHSLKKHVDANQFNSELYYALDITSIAVPALRQRKEEIEHFARSFLQQFKQQTGKPDLDFSYAALNKIKSYYWPGNITQLKNVVYKACMVSNESLVQAEHLEIEGQVQIEASLENSSLPKAVAEFERHFIQHWYQKYPSTRKLAAQLGVSHTTIAQKLNKYEIK